MAASERPGAVRDVSWRRAVLRIFLASVVLNAALGIYALLAGEFGDLEAKILLTSVSVSVASVLALACAPAWARQKLMPIPIIGVVAVLGTFALVMVAIWGALDSETLLRTTWTVGGIALVAVHASLLSLATLSARFRWAFYSALASSVVLASLLVPLIWSDLSNDWYLRLVGVVAVLLAASTITVPALHWASRREIPEEGLEERLVRFCPACGRSVSGEEGRMVDCPACGAEFTVRFSTPTEDGDDGTPHREKGSVTESSSTETFPTRRRGRPHRTERPASRS